MTTIGKQGIVVEADGDRTRAVIEQANHLELVDKMTIEHTLKTRMARLASSFGATDTEAVGVKKCSRCAKLGRMHIHPVAQFSRLKNGKLLSQCKVCRVEQTVKWDKEQGDRRKEYQKDYQKRRKPAVRRQKVEVVAEQRRSTEKAMFVALTGELIDTAA